ncbi:hypothetical protein SD77_3424 [Bacillus badius]|uniref:Phage protein n=2 Tax=Bacillus badius TaxID=1455 RepID=A0ABR5ANX2_BACBA|nr:hypothetical protein SD77_3424 [Bacillus badius]
MGEGAMEYRELMDWKGHIYLNTLSEPLENSLRILIDKCKISHEREGAHAGKYITEISPIEGDINFPIIQLDFDSYVSYTITNESFTVMDDYEVYQGEVFRIYTKSRYLDFVKLGTIAEDVFPEERFVHYQVPCLNHIIDIISFESPRITEVKRG